MGTVKYPQPTVVSPMVAILVHALLSCVLYQVWQMQPMRQDVAALETFAIQTSLFLQQHPLTIKFTHPFPVMSQQVICIPVVWSVQFYDVTITSSI